MASPSSEEPQQSHESQQPPQSVKDCLGTHRAFCHPERQWSRPSPRHLNSMGSWLRQNLQVAEVFVLGTFAGQGCSGATEYLKEHLFENLMKHPNLLQSPS